MRAGASRKIQDMEAAIKNRQTTSRQKASGNNDLNKSAQPVLRVKNRGGAPKGNRNALKHGLRSAALIAFRRRIRLHIAKVRMHIALALAADALRGEAVLGGGEPAFGFDVIGGGSESVKRHVAVHAFELARLDQIGLVPDADLAVIAHAADELRPGGEMLAFPVMRIGEQF